MRVQIVHDEYDLITVGIAGIIWHFINIQNILHAGYEFRVFFGRDAPVGIFVRSKFIFLCKAYCILSDWDVQFNTGFFF